MGMGYWDVGVFEPHDPVADAHEVLFTLAGTMSIQGVPSIMLVSLANQSESLKHRMITYLVSNPNVSLQSASALPPHLRPDSSASQSNSAPGTPGNSTSASAGVYESGRPRRTRAAMSGGR